MTWLWLNMPMGAAFFAAWTAIPLWLVLKHPDTAPGPQASAVTPAPAGPAGRPEGTAPAGERITALAANGRSGEALSAPRLPPSASRSDMSPRRTDAKMTRAGHRCRYDAIVVGARVAGAAAAMLLARRGFDVLLVDRARFPSEIPHGHYVHMHGPPRLAAWGLLDRVLATGCPPITSITMDLGDFPLTGRGLAVDGVPVGIAPRRAVLDKVLIDAAIEAGAEFRDRFPVHDLTVEDGRVTGIRGRGGLTKRARFVIGADGRNSQVARRVGAPVYAEQPTLACWYFSYWSGVAWDGLEMYRRGHRMIFAHPTNDGRFAMFVGWPIAELRAVRRDIEAQMMAVVDRVPDLSQRVRSGRREERIYGAAQLPNFLRKPYGPGWALVGDAGCHKDPVRALGICDALRDAELLADSLTATLSGGRAEAEALSEYERRRNEATTDDYEANLRAARFSPPTPEILQARAAARDDPQAMAQFCLAWEGRIPRQTPAAEQHEPPRAGLDAKYRPTSPHAETA
jgi:flavin-dependent dehydrogenase